ncbi:uncharacterized protein LOC130429049 [Triplophysa dalaica]|uniref:uncharacterized protein LOC130429049 n=1 Tax=Triplophysa dalaica TaxID=1582913 RepID=UPI0024DF87A9|nr:uncharacterized protein LOC130429049 [Triplophysa dalaica]
MESEGYSGRQLRSVSNSGKNVIFLVPLQEESDTQPLPYNSAEFAKMPKVPCVTCNTILPMQLLALHAEEWKLNSNEKTDVVIVEDENEDCNIEEKVTNTPDREVSEDSLGMCPICQNVLPFSILHYHGSLCAERSFRNDTLLKDYLDQPGPSSMSHTSQLSSSSEPSTEVWRTVEDPHDEAIRLFFERLREGGDAATGNGVTRDILSTTIAKIKRIKERETSCLIAG